MLAERTTILPTADEKEAMPKNTRATTNPSIVRECVCVCVCFVNLLSFALHHLYDPSTLHHHEMGRDGIEREIALSQGSNMAFVSNNVRHITSEKSLSDHTPTVNWFLPKPVRSQQNSSLFPSFLRFRQPFAFQTFISQDPCRQQQKAPYSSFSFTGHVAANLPQISRKKKGHSAEMQKEKTKMQQCRTNKNALSAFSNAA